VNLQAIQHLTDSTAVSGIFYPEKEVARAFSSDLMSDVLTLDNHDIILISGLANIQLIRTAEMADIEVILLARGKKATTDMIELANENNIVIMETPYSIYRASGVLYVNGLQPVY
jgi:hypothetical protein